ncbi:CGNR zinc finger domain-containing protein [Amycolatopsis sp. NPDC058278]|uniref:CGNR zinc finger domain-containing protein n=1 Tax=Amycolatopsis sp. NPDC058278 TaxID=3346417 RepID=UPI0036DB5995
MTTPPSTTRARCSPTEPGAVQISVRTAADGSWQRMKSCGAPDCGWVFYDHSKPHHARWCSTAGCGNRMKTRAYRDRKG